MGNGDVNTKIQKEVLICFLCIRLHTSVPACGTDMSTPELQNLFHCQGFSLNPCITMYLISNSGWNKGTKQSFSILFHGLQNEGVES